MAELLPNCHLLLFPGCKGYHTETWLEMTTLIVPSFFFTSCKQFHFLLQSIRNIFACFKNVLIFQLDAPCPLGKIFKNFLDLHPPGLQVNKVEACLDNNHQLSNKLHHIIDYYDQTSFLEANKYTYKFCV